MNEKQKWAKAARDAHKNAVKLCRAIEHAVKVTAKSKLRF